MAGHGVLLAAFFMERDRPARAAGPQVFDFHFESRADAREAVGERGDERAVPQIAKRRGRNGVEELAPFLALEHRRSARLHDVLRSAGGRRIRTLGPSRKGSAERSNISTR